MKGRYIKSSLRKPPERRRVLGYMPMYIFPDMQLRIVVFEDGVWKEDRTGEIIPVPVEYWCYIPIPSEEIQKEERAKAVQKGREIEEARRNNASGQ